jgi:hypothetical protein
MRLDLYTANRASDVLLEGCWDVWEGSNHILKDTPQSTRGSRRCYEIMWNPRTPISKAMGRSLKRDDSG